MKLKFNTTHNPRILTSEGELPHEFGEHVVRLYMAQAYDGHWYWHAEGELYASIYQKCGRFSTGTAEEVRAKAEELDWTLKFLRATCITTYSVDIPTNEEHLQETLRTLNTAMTLIEEMKSDIAILRAGMTEIRREAEELQRRRSVSVQYIIDRASLALEMTARE